MFIALSCTWRKVKILCSGNMYKLMTVYISDQHINIPNFRCHSTSNTKAITLRDSRKWSLMSYLPLSCWKSRLSEDSLSKADFYPVKSGMQREMTHDISSFQKCTDGKVVAGTCFSRDKQIHTGYQTDMASRFFLRLLKSSWFWLIYSWNKFLCDLLSSYSVLYRSCSFQVI